MSNDTVNGESLQDFLNLISEATCYPYDSRLKPSYGYRPSLAAGIIFVVLFAIPLVYHTFQSIRRRAAISILLALGALTEVIGWASRIYASRCPYSGAAFMAQEVTLIIAPVFFSAALYVLLGQLIHRAPDPKSVSMITPRMYAIVFCTCDVVSLVVQAVGGAMASEADTDTAQKNGTHIMVAGIAFQLVTMALFGLLGADFARRVTKGWGLGNAGGLRLDVLVVGTVSFTMIFVRGIYRTIELAQGWRGYLITHEGYFIGLDAVIMVVAVGVFVVGDPAVVMKREGGQETARKSADIGSSDSETGLAMGTVERS